MDLVKSVISFFSKKEKGDEPKAPEGVCPNCWGSQEYAGVIRDLEKDIQVDVAAGTAKHAFIQEFVVKHVNGIKLRNKLEGQTCDKCRMVYPNEG